MARVTCVGDTCPPDLADRNACALQALGELHPAVQYRFLACYLDGPVPIDACAFFAEDRFRPDRLVSASESATAPFILDTGFASCNRGVTGCTNCQRWRRAVLDVKADGVLDAGEITGDVPRIRSQPEI